MDSGKARELACRYARLARRTVPYERAVLFGSHARGDAEEHSDIDIAFFAERLAPGTTALDTLKALYRLAMEVDVHIEPHLFVRGEDPTGFGEVVERTGVPLDEG